MITDRTCGEFLQSLSSASPIPGGGGASAVVGAVGTALGSMVANLTSGKKKYVQVQEEIELILGRANALGEEFLKLAENDAEVFEPLSSAYGLPLRNEEERRYKEKTMETALKAASTVPLEIMRKTMEALELHERLAEIGTRIAVSDVGVGALFCKAALMGAGLNVFINTRMMKDRDFAEEINSKARTLIKVGTEKADRIYEKVEAAVQ